MLCGEVQNVQTLHTHTHFCPAGNHPGHAKCKQVTQSIIIWGILSLLIAYTLKNQHATFRTKMWNLKRKYTQYSDKLIGNNYQN